MPGWTRKLVAIYLVIVLSLGWAGPLAALDQGSPGSQDTSSVTKSKTTTSSDQATGEEVKTVLDKLMLALAGSPLLVRVLAVQLQKYGGEKVRKWARESYFLVDQVMAHAEKSGVLTGPKNAKAREFQRQFKEILKEADWLDRIVMKAKGSETVFNEAMREAEKIHERTFHGEVAQLEADGRISIDEAVELLKMKRRGLLTPRELGKYLLNESTLNSREILELMRTYETRTRIRVTGRRDSRYDATVLELLEPWKDPKRTDFKTRVDRKTVAKLLGFQGSLDDYTEVVLRESGLTGREAQKIVDEFALELKKEASFKRSLMSKHAATGGSASGGGVSPRPSGGSASGGGVSPRPSGGSASGEGVSPRRPGTSGQVLEFKRRSALSKRVMKMKSRINATSGTGHWVGGGVDGIKQSFKYDFLRGGILVDVGMTAATNVFFRLKRGDSFGESLSGAVSTIASSEFVFGDLLGGSIGAALGCAVPLPGVLASMGLFGRFLGALPTIGLTIAGAQLGYASISLLKRGQFSLKALFNEVKPGLLIGQAVGAALGMSLGNFFLPGPIGSLLGGLAGGIIGAQIATWLFKYEDGRIFSQSAHVPAAPAGTIDPELGLVGINPSAPSSADMRAISQAVRDAYSSYIEAQKKGAYLESTRYLKRYQRLEKLLDGLVRKGYRVK